jgi:hypothetical protein
MGSKPFTVVWDCRREDFPMCAVQQRAHDACTTALDAASLANGHGMTGPLIEWWLCMQAMLQHDRSRRAVRHNLEGPWRPAGCGQGVMLQSAGYLFLDCVHMRLVIAHRFIPPHGDSRWRMFTAGSHLHHDHQQRHRRRSPLCHGICKLQAHQPAASRPHWHNRAQLWWQRLPCQAQDGLAPVHQLAHGQRI